MPDDPWEQCAAVVSRVESRLRSSIDREIFRSTAQDLTAAMPAISATSIRCHANGSWADPLAEAGKHSGGEPDLRRSEWLGEESQLSIEIWFDERVALSPAGLRAIEETAEALCGLLIGALARIRLGESQQELRAIGETTSHLFSDSEPGERLHRIAVELGRKLDVNRISLLRRVGGPTPGGPYEFLASSVQARFDARAERVLQIQSVAAALQDLDFPDGQPLVLERDQSLDRIRSFLVSGNCDRLVAMSWNSGELIAIGEAVAGASNKAYAGASNQLRHELSDVENSLFEAALTGAARCRPMGVVHRLRRSFLELSNRRRMAMVLGFAMLLMLWPIAIVIVADGRVVPRSQHVVYSPISGEIERIDCETGTHVVADQILCVFSSYELDRDLTELRGELLTVREQLRIATTRRGEDLGMEISSDRRVLTVRLGELEKQLKLLEARQANLVIRSPIAGVVSLVVPDDLGSLTAGRPIQVGQPVIRVIDADAGYRVELEIPDEEIGYVVAAMNRRELKPVNCSFRIRSDPEVERSGELIKLEQTATPNRLGQLVVVGAVDPVDPNSQFASESGVTGWIKCNRSAAGFVLFRKVIERLRIGGWL